MENLKEFSMHLKLPSLFKNTILSDNHEAAAVVKEMMDENYVTVTQHMMHLAEERKGTKMLELIRHGNCDMDQRKNNYLRKAKENYTILGKLFLYVASLKSPQIILFPDKMPKSKEFEFDSTKSTQLLKIKKISFENLLNNFKIQEIHYTSESKSECDLGCHQKEKCDFARKACQVAEYIVEDLRSADRLFNFVESPPFVVGSTKENTKIFSMGRLKLFLILLSR